MEGIPRSDFNPLKSPLCLSLLTSPWEKALKVSRAGQAGETLLSGTGSAIPL